MAHARDHRVTCRDHIQGRPVPARKRAGLPARRHPAGTAARPAAQHCRAGLVERAAAPLAHEGERLRARRSRRASTISPPCRSPSRPICATPIPSACSPARWRTWCGCTPPAAPPASRSWWPTRAQDLDVWTSRDGAQLRRLRAARAATSCRTPTATACSPAAWARTTAPKRLGATVIPISGGNTDRQIMVMSDFGVTAICCTPSYFLHLLERAAELGVDVRELPLRAGVFGAEPWTESMRRHIEAAGGIQAFDIYGLSEIIGPGVARRVPRARTACTSSRTTSTRRSSIPRPAEPLPDGDEGELVLTTLSKQAMPMIRYRTRDITALDAGRLPLRPHAAAHAAHRRAAATTCSSFAASTSSPRRSKRRCWRWKARCRTTRSSSPASRAWTRWRSRWR